MKQDQEQRQQEQQVASKATPVDVSQLTDEQKAALLAQLNAENQNNRQEKRKAYEELRKEFMAKVHENLINLVGETKSFRQWLEKESAAFTAVMREYGEVKYDGQQSYTITDGNFRLSITSNKVKGFDERADLAAERLVTFLNDYMSHSSKGSEDPMYQLAMTLLERNKAGKLDYKSISKLYEMEDKFGSPEYSDIMQLFKESNVVQENAINFYFYHRNDMGVWVRDEPSFCRL